MKTILFILRDACWLGADRALAWTKILAIASVFTALALITLTLGGSAPDPWRRPLATDFTSFWTAGKLALHGAPALAWDPSAHATEERVNFPLTAGFSNDYYAFFYPPIFLLVCVPLALLPYGMAAMVWLGTTGAACFTVVKALLPDRWPAALVFLAFPALLINAGNGQNGTLSTALLGGAALQLDKRPQIAGACLGMLCFKPQLALFVVPALIAARRWQVLRWASIVSGGLFLSSLLVFGKGAWLAFLSVLPLAGEVLKFGGAGFAKMVSTFAAIRLLGASIACAWSAQALVALVALFVVVIVARRRPGSGPESATLAVATCLGTPFLFDYDLMLLLVPLAWVAAMADGDRFKSWEKLILGSAFLLPLLARPLATLVNFPAAPLVLGALLWTIAQRARLTDSSRCS